MSRSQDLLSLMRGISIVANASVKTQEAYLKHLWSNSSVRDVLEQKYAQTQQCGKKIVTNPGEELQQIGKLLRETLDRSSVVVEGIKQYGTANTNFSVESVKEFATPSKITDLKNLDIASITLTELENLLSEHNKNRNVSLRIDQEPKNTKTSKKSAKKDVSVDQTPTYPVEPIVAPLSVKPIPSTIISPSFKPTEKALLEDEKRVQSVLSFISSYDKESIPEPVLPVEGTVHNIKLPELNSVAKQRTVPSSRIHRVASFGSLFAGLGIGTVSELAKGALGMGGSLKVKEALFSPQNAERIVDTLCKVRGAALKLGQILSIQDSNIVSPQLIKAFDRVRQAADYMPDWQVKKVLVGEFGEDWRNKFKSFDDKPFAAASIGQVHRAVTLDGIEVAIKIQYPGVAQSIESDIDNLVSMLKVWDVFPPGVFIDNVVKVAKRELAWEVDYNREAEFTINFGEMIAKYPDFKVPKVFTDLSTNRVLTTELVPGVPMDQCFNYSEEHRNHIAKLVMTLCLKELFEFRCMQTDPNWSNFLYDESTKKLMLIDFGATRFYTKEFMDNYLKVIIAATEDNREAVHKLSLDMGFLTGYESQAMTNAHVDAVMILGEVFSVEGPFDFGGQKTTRKIASLVPVMIAHRLCPPPEEIYSLHRKLSGVFLLCSKLQAKIPCKPLFEDIVKNYKF